MVSLASLVRPLFRAMAQQPDAPAPEKIPAATVDAMEPSVRTSTPAAKSDPAPSLEGIGRAISTGLTVSRRAAIALPILLGAGLLDSPAQAQTGPTRTDYVLGPRHPAFNFRNTMRARTSAEAAPSRNFVFDRAAVARFFVQQSKGAIKEVSNPFPG